jgi:hypothetical protein
MRSLLRWVVVMAVSAGCASAAPADPAGASAVVTVQRELHRDYALPFEELDVLLGVRSFDEVGADPNEDQGLIGLDFAESAGLGNLWLEGGIHYTFDEESDVVVAGTEYELGSDTLELSVGLLFGGWFGRWRPFVGAGASFLFVDLDRVDQGVVVEDEDTTPGGYGKIGLLFAVSERAHVGIEYRRFEGADLSLGGTELDPGSDTLALIFGTSF